MSTDDQLAERVLKAYAHFDMALHSKGPFPDEKRILEGQCGQWRKKRNLHPRLRAAGESRR